MSRAYYTTAAIVKNRLSQIDTVNLDDSEIEENIRQAEGIIDSVMRWTFRTASDSGTLTGGTSSTVTDNTKTWTTNQWADYSVMIWSGTGTGQIKVIASNTGSILTVKDSFGTTPVSGDKYEIVPFNEYQHDIIRDTATCMAAFMCLLYDTTKFSSSTFMTTAGDMLWSIADRNMAILSDPKTMDYLKGL